MGISPCIACKLSFLVVGLLFLLSFDYVYQMFVYMLCSISSICFCELEMYLMK